MVGHPFVVRAADGSLPRATFDRWVVEDHAFVVAFRGFLEALSEVAPDQRARDVLDGGLAALTPELEMFEREARRRGLELDVDPAPLNQDYSAYLLAAARGGWAVGITVLFGVEKAYYDAWASVRDAASPGTPYAEFIRNWSSPEFAVYVDQLAGLVDREPLTEEMRQAFDRVVRFELAFWDLVCAHPE